MVQITSEVGDEPPHEAEEQPCDRVDQHEDEEVEPPLEVHQCGEYVCQVTVRLPNVPVMDVALAVFLDIPLDLLGPVHFCQLFRQVLAGLLWQLGLSDDGWTFHIMLHGHSEDSSLWARRHWQV